MKKEINIIICKNNIVNLIKKIKVLIYDKSKKIFINIKIKNQMDVSGIEPEAFRMQIERDTTTPYTRTKYYS